MGQGAVGARGMGTCHGLAPSLGGTPKARGLRDLRPRAQAPAPRLRDAAGGLERVTRRIAEKAPDGAQVPSVIRAIIDPEQCTGCGVCVGFCPERAITLGDAATVDAARCAGCGECVGVCPNAAVSLSEAERGAAGCMRVEEEGER
jgi:Pyruvate/2-oxoacid:ferredoxin oxidoreductase delta subunit